MENDSKNTNVLIISAVESLPKLGMDKLLC